MHSYSYREWPSDGLELGFLKSGHTISQTSLQIFNQSCSPGDGVEVFYRARSSGCLQLQPPPELSVREIEGDKRERKRKRKGGRKPAGGGAPLRHTAQRDARPLPAHSRHKPSLCLNINKEVQQCITALFPVNKNCTSRSRKSISWKQSENDSSLVF